MTEFVSIVEAQSRFMKHGKKNSSICATAIHIGDLKSSSEGIWTKKDITLKDDSGEQVLTAWTPDIKKFELNTMYKIESPYWTEYNGKIQLSLGKYATVTIAAIDEQSIEKPISPLPDTEVITDQDKRINDLPRPTPDEYLKNKQTDNETKDFDNTMQKLIVSVYDNDTLSTIYQNIDKLIALEHMVKSKLKERNIELNAQKIGMYVKLVNGMKDVIK